MDKPTIIFRADGNSNIGMGHFNRALALAEMLYEDFNCIFAMRQPTQQQIVEIEKICHSFINLPEDDSHFGVFLTCLKGNEIVVLDNYYFTTEYQKTIKAKGCKLVCIDDMHDKHYVANLVINHAPGLKENDFSKEVYTKLLLGPEYSLVKKIFRNNIFKSTNISELPKSILIVFGGSDFYNLTQLYSEYIVGLNMFDKINIITGSGYKYLNELKLYLVKNEKKNIFHFHNVTSEKIKQLAIESDIAIAPSSTILFELLFLKKAVISGYYVDNQINIYNGFAELDLIFKFGNFNNISNLKNLLSSISILDLNRVISNLQNTFNNKIDLRIKSEFKDLLTEYIKTPN